MPRTHETELPSGGGSLAGSSEPSLDSRVMQLALRAFRVRKQDEVLMSSSTMLQLFTEEVLAPLRDWCAAHGAALRSCHVALHDGAPTIFVIPAADGYDFLLDTPLAGLEMDLHRKGYSCVTLQLPGGRSSLCPGYLKGKNVIQVYPASAQVS